ncbi:MAG TPA: DUF3515 domain-containing protein [Candidatus Limnocylindrales bacterium]
MNVEERRSATRVATLVAVPLAVLAGLVAFQVLKPDFQDTGPVTMLAIQLDERQTVVCRALLAHLPGQVRDRQRRPVTAGPEQNAAFGDPAITVACGGKKPAFAPTDVVYPLSGVCWIPDASGTTWTTVDREVPVVVTVPQEYDSPGQWVAAFSAPVFKAILSADVPSGCKPQSQSQ